MQFTGSTIRLGYHNASLMLYGKLRERARCGEFCTLIGYPSGQDEAILPAREGPFFPAIIFRRSPSGSRKVFFRKIFSLTVKRFSVISLSGWN